jgi:Right handed beta helix region
MATVRTNTSIKQAAAGLKEGDTLEVAGGVYDDVHIYDIPSNVRIVAAPGAVVWIRPPSGDACIWLSKNQHDIEFDGINLDATNTTNGALKVEGWSVTDGNPHHVTFKNAEVIGSRDYSTIAIIFACLERGIIGHNQLINVRVHGGGLYDRDHGIYVQSSDNLIDSCEFFDLCGAGVQFYNGYGLGQSGNVIRNTHIHDLRRGVSGDNGALGRHAGIYAYSQNDLQVQGVTIERIPDNGGGAQGIEISADNVVVDGCTIRYVQGYAVCGTSGSGNVVRNSDLRGNQGTIAGDVASENNQTEGPPVPIPPDPPDVVSSPAGTRVSLDTTITDAEGGQWTLAGDQSLRVLRDGQYSGGNGNQILILDKPAPGSIFVKGLDASWWQWDGGTTWHAVRDPTRA